MIHRFSSRTGNLGETFFSQDRGIACRLQILPGEERLSDHHNHEQLLMFYDIAKDRV